MLGLRQSSPAASSIPEICGDAALFVNPESIEDIADKMMALYKDEKLRNELIAKGYVQAKKYSWDITADLLWQGIDKTLHG